MNKNEVKILLWPDENAWDEKATVEIIQSFQPFIAEKDRSSAIGAGASGLNPELNILLEFVKDNYQKFLVEGFIKAVGAETLKLLINSFKKAARVKPQPQNYGIGYNVTSADLILYVRAGGREILVTMVLNEEQDFDKAFDSLPRALDKAFNSNVEFGRLYWMDGKWKAM